MSITYQQGSEWRLWDLHIHTPMSIENQYGGNETKVWDEFIDRLQNLPSDVKVIGINDYYFTDGYEKVMSYREKGYLQNLDMIFPVLEFRVDTFGTNDGKGFLKSNLHILFNVDMNDYKKQIKKVKEEFIGRINLSGLEKHKTKVLSRENFASEASDGTLKKGFSEYVPSTKQVLEIINSPTWKEDVFLFLGFKEWDNSDKGNQIKPYKIDMLSKVNGLFTASPLKGIPKKQDTVSRLGDKRLFHSLDIHNFNEFDDYLCYTWIKADPTFEGLKQILYAPERIKIQEEHPDTKLPKPYFSYIKLSDENIFSNKDIAFKECVLPLNRDLITIIGGRGTGKSLLLDSIAKTLNKTNGTDRASQIDLLTNFQLTLTQEDGTERVLSASDVENNFVEYTHVSQSEVQSIAEDPKKLGDTILDLLMIYTETITVQEEDAIQEIISSIIENKRWLNQINEDGELINSKAFNLEKKKLYEKKIESITNEQNKELIDKYRDNKINKSSLENYNTEIIQFREYLNDVEEYANDKIGSLNDKFSMDDEKLRITKIHLEQQINKLKELEDHVNTTISKANEENKKIEQDFREKGIEGDISTLLGKVEGYQNNIEKYKQNIDKIDAVNLEIENQLHRRKKFADYLKDRMIRRIDEVYDKWSSLKQGNTGWTEEQISLINEILEGIQVYAEIYFDKDLFYSKFEQCLNGNKFRVSRGSMETKQDKINNFINVNNYTDFLKLISNEPIININNNEALITLETLFDEYNEYLSSNGGQDILNLLFTANEREQYLNVIPLVEYNNKKPEELSIGQRGTLYISLKLATDSFSNPFVFDQPEDDLDNMFIVEKLIPIFKKLKKYRQIIIVTHNANIVVNADADQVIVAHNEYEKLSYISGSLENTFKIIEEDDQDLSIDILVSQGIKEHVCDILEGGSIAFLNREKRYSIKPREIERSKTKQVKEMEPIL